MKKFLFLILGVVMSLMADFKSIEYKDIKSILGENVVLIDIRRPQEWAQTGIVPNSKKITFFDEKGNYDAKKWLDEFSKYVKTKEQPFVLICRTAHRTKLVGQFLQKQGYKNVYDLKGGITYGYINKGLKTVDKK
jgi:rhodanese-related sulfurtransferase